MCIKSNKSKSRHQNNELGQSGPKTWSQRRAEWLVHKAPTSPTSEFDDFLPDLDHSPELLYLGLEPSDSSLTMDSQRHMRERHFLDSLSSFPYSKQMIENVDFQKVKNVKRSLSPQKEISPGRIKRRAYRISQEMQAGSTPVHVENYEVFVFPYDKPLKPCERTSSVVIKPDKRRIRVRFLQDLTTFPSTSGGELCKDFVRLQSSHLDDLSDDISSLSNFASFANILEDFCFNRKPSSALIQKILNNGFFSKVDEKVTDLTYFTLLKIWQNYPELLKIDSRSILVAGDILQKHLQNTSHFQGSSSISGSGDNEVCSFHQARLYFQFIVKSLQLNLSRCILADQISVNKTKVFSCLSSEGSQVLLKQLIRWLDFCLVVIVRDPQHQVLAQQWMHELQTLLGASILVSRDRQMAAKNLAPELKKIYKYLTDLSARKQFLHSFSCPLLGFYVLRLVIEDQCKSTILSSSFPSTIQEVVHNYFFALPPQDHLTPPPSPSDDDLAAVQGHLQAYSSESCEELAILVYFITKNFIACVQRRLNGDLRLQMLKGPNLPTLTTEERAKFQHGVQEFADHLGSLTTELSTVTNLYLKLLGCLCFSA